MWHRHFSLHVLAAKQNTVERAGLCIHPAWDAHASIAAGMQVPGLYKLRHIGTLTLSTSAVRIYAVLILIPTARSLQRDPELRPSLSKVAALDVVRAGTLHDAVLHDH